MKMKITLLATALSALSIALAQDKTTAERNALLERARSGDPLAISQMEREHDLQDLKTLMLEPGQASKLGVRLSLARLGDTDALQVFACESLTNDGGSPIFMRDVLNRIGGGFAVQVYRQLLDSDPRFLPPIQKAERKCVSEKKAMDCVSPAPPSILALFELPKLVPNSPIPAPSSHNLGMGDDGGALKDQWRTWIDTHQVELRDLRPTAEGISFDSGFCSKVGHPVGH